MAREFEHRQNPQQNVSSFLLDLQKTREEIAYHFTIPNERVSDSIKEEFRPFTKVILNDPSTKEALVLVNSHYAKVRKSLSRPALIATAIFILVNTAFKEKASNSLQRENIISFAL